MDIYTYLDSIDPSSYVGVDAITFTAKDEIGMTGLNHILLSLQDRLEVEETKPFNYMGAKGWTKGPVAYAIKQDRYGKGIWAIMMVRGALAQQCFAYKIFSLKATRIDLRIDVKLSKECKKLAQMYYTIASKQEGANPRLIQSLTGDTFYPETNRESMYYGRIYDKSPEYGEDLGNVWRYEVEIKRSAADQIADIIMECHDIETFITETVFGIFKENWKVPSPGVGVKPRLNYVGLSAVSTEKKIDWLKRTVSPSVRHLTRIGLLDEALSAMGVSATQLSMFKSIEERDSDGSGI
jgi:hypothetical protein